MGSNTEMADMAEKDKEARSDDDRLFCDFNISKQEEFTYVT